MKIADAAPDEFFAQAERLFREHYETVMWLERRRRNFLITTILVLTLCCMLMAFTGYILWQDLFQGGIDSRITGYITLALFTQAGFSFYVYRHNDQLYRRMAKRKFLGLLAGVWKMGYRHNGFFPLVSVYDHHILPAYQGRVVEEGFSARINGIRIEFQDFLINPVRRYFDGSGYSSRPTLKNYYGLAVKVQLHKYFQHHTVLLPASEQRRFLAQLPNPHLFLHQDVNLVYSQFSHHYTCLSTNQVEARYALDPAVMERFIKLVETFQTDKISVSFMKDEMVLVLRPEINLFEIGSLREAVTVLTIERTLQQIYALRQIVEIFELDIFSGLGARVP